MKYTSSLFTLFICLFSQFVVAFSGGKLQRSSELPNFPSSDFQNDNRNRGNLLLRKRWVDVDDDDTSAAPSITKHSEGGKDNTDFTKIVESFNNGLTERLGSLSDSDRLMADQLGEQDDKYIKAAAEESVHKLGGPHVIVGKASDLDRYSSQIDPDVHKQIQAALAQDGNSPEALREVSSALIHGMPPPEIIESTNHALHTPVHQESIMMQPQQFVSHPKAIHRYIGRIIHRIRPAEHRYIPMKHIFLKHMPQILQRLRLRPHFRAIHRPRIIIVKEPHVQHHHEYYEEPEPPPPPEVSVCSINPCRNGGICNDMLGEVHCVCAEGFMGDRCDAQNACRPNPCKNGGECSESEHGVVCTCVIPYMGPTCEAMSHCHPNPCRNGGSCYERSNGFSCQCSSGYKGPTCTVASFCHPINPCKNEGVCSEDDTTYKCSCGKGFIGQNCEVRKYTCSVETCQNGGTCMEDGVNVLCHCLEDFRGKSCEERIFKPCTFTTCLFGGTCIETSPYDFKCLCPKGRAGKRCTIPLKNPCDDCHVSAVCINHRCFCREGYVGNGYNCERGPSHCHPNPCENDGKCIDKYDFFSPVDRRGSQDDSKDPEAKLYFHMTQNPGPELVTPVDPQLLSENGEKPSNPVSDVSQRSHVVDRIQEKIPSKHSEITIAKRNGIAHVKRHYVLKNKKLRRRKVKKSHIQGPDIDRSWKYSRLGNTNQTLTKRNLILTKKLPANVDQTELEIDGFVCVCPEHYRGKKCEQVNACQPNPCKNAGKCIEVDGIPVCTCPHPYVGQFCESTNSCEPNPCRNGGTCIDNDGTPVCTCPKQYTGDTCEVDKCRKCSKAAICINGVCQCKRGYSGDGITCTPVDRVGGGDPCASNPCLNGGTCVQSNSQGGFSCHCVPPYMGKTCADRRGGGEAVTTTVAPQTTPSKDILCHPNPCLNDGKCVIVGSTFICRCPKEYKGPRCETDKCIECDVHARCIEGKCTCNRGYSGDGFNCDPICENPCPKHSTCEDGQCVCNKGYFMEENICIQPQAAHSPSPPPPPPPHPPPPPPPPHPPPPPPPPPSPPPFIFYGPPSPPPPPPPPPVPMPAPAPSPVLAVEQGMEIIPGSQVAAATHAAPPVPGPAPSPYAEDIIISVYQSLGCWADAADWWNPQHRTIPSLEGTDYRLMDEYRMRKDPIGKCADVAKERGFKVFAIQNGGHCMSGLSADHSYMKHGSSEKCKNGIGGPTANDVYRL